MTVSPGVERVGHGAGDGSAGVGAVTWRVSRVAVLYVNPVGSVSVTRTPVAVDGPLFVTVMVNTASSPIVRCSDVRFGDRQVRVGDDVHRHRLRCCSSLFESSV